MRKHIAVSLGVTALACLVAVGAAAQQSSTQFGGQKSTQLAAPAAGPASAEERAALQVIMDTNDTRERLALVEQFLAKWPQSSLRAGAYTAASEAYRLQKDYDKAVEYGEHALELNPRDPFALILVSESLAEGAVPIQADYQERLVRGEEYARRALEVLPELFAAATRRPETPEEEYIAQQKYWEAQPHATLGYIYLRKNDYLHAAEELKLATELNQYRPNALDFLRLGLAQYREKHYAEAEASLQRCVEIGGPAAETAQRHLTSVRRLLEAQQQTEEKKP